MKKSDRKSILENLDKALDPPGGRRRPALASKFADYDDSEDTGTPPPSGTTGVTPVTPVSGVTPVAGEGIAPKRDFARVANSIVRDVVPAGIFTGKGKQLYDYLYSQTRGAIVPKMSARLRTEAVIKAAGMSRPTYKAHIGRLMAVGLISVEERVGEHGGNIFTVYLPEELGNSGKWGNPSNPTNSSKELEGQVGQESYSGNPSLSSQDATISGDLKTSFKTKDQDDDEKFGQPLRALERELTGKAAPAAKWEPLFELLAAELKTAASRTGGVSDAPAFFAAHMRRRLARPDAPPKTGKRATATESAPLTAEEIAPPAPDDVEEFERARAELEGKTET